ncbi:MAG: YveK family protein [Bacillaceae bacterium]
MEETWSLKELIFVLKKRIWLIIVMTFSAAVISGIISYFFLTPVYETSTQILVKQDNDGEMLYQSSEIQTNVQLINTYSVIIKSPLILDEVGRKLQLGLSGEQLKGKINVLNEKDSLVFSLVVQDKDPFVAMKIANTTADVFREKIEAFMKVENVTVLSPAKVTESASPIKPKPLSNIVIALVLGLTVSVALAFLLEYLDDTLKTETDIENKLQLPLLGTITRANERDMLHHIGGDKIENRRRTAG